MLKTDLLKKDKMLLNSISYGFPSICRTIFTSQRSCNTPMDLKRMQFTSSFHLLFLLFLLLI